ncbi:hypothetical protein ACV3UL_08740 [Clostridium perfringens]
MDKLMFQIRRVLFKRKKDLNSLTIGLSLILSAVFLIIGYKTVLSPLKEKYQSQMNDIFLYNSNISTLPELSLSSEIMNQKVDDIKDVASKMNNIVPDKRNVPFVTSQISLAAANNKVDIAFMEKALETNVSLGDDNFGVVKYNLTCFSSYENIVNFLATLETSNSIFAIEEVEIQPLSEDEVKKYNDISLVRTDLTVNIYMKANSN